MVDATKLQELVSNGVGSKSPNFKPRTEVTEAKARAAASLKRAMGTMQKAGDNLYVCVGGILGSAMRLGLLDIVVAECAGRTEWGKSPSSKFIGMDFPEVPRSYSAIVGMVKKHAQDTDADFYEIITGKTFLSPLNAIKDRKAFVAFMFADFGPFGDHRDFYPAPTATGGRAPRARFHSHIASTCLKGLAVQAAAMADNEKRVVRVGIPRLYGATGGISFMHLMQLLDKELSQYSNVEFYVFASKTPDGALICPVDPTRPPKRKQVSKARPGQNRRRPSSPRQGKPTPTRGC